MKKINLCEYCGLSRNPGDESKLKNHACRNKNEVFCTECENCFASNLILRRHIESVHRGMLYTCKECQNTFKSLASMKRHIKKHQQSSKKLACDTCWYWINDPTTQVCADKQHGGILQINAFSVRMKK